MNVIEIIDRLQAVTLEAKTEYLRQKLLDYYKTVNRGVVSIPPFILANQDIERIKKTDSVDFWFKKMVSARI